MINCLQWFEEFQRLGYYVVKRGRSAHWKVYGPEGDLVAVVSATPSDHNSWLSDRAVLRRHQQRREAAARKISTSTRPESPAQVCQWEKVKARYIRAGLCDPCAAQAAWAHQPGAGGWSGIKPPCSVCGELMAAAFPYPTTNPLWRSVLRKRASVTAPRRLKSGGRTSPGAPNSG